MTGFLEGLKIGDLFCTGPLKGSKAARPFGLPPACHGRPAPPENPPKSVHQKQRCDSFTSKGSFCMIDHFYDSHGKIDRRRYCDVTTGLMIQRLAASETCGLAVHGLKAQLAQVKDSPSGGQRQGRARLVASPLFRYYHFMRLFKHPVVNDDFQHSRSFNLIFILKQHILG